MGSEERKLRRDVLAGGLQNQRDHSSGGIFHTCPIWYDVAMNADISSTIIDRLVDPLSECLTLESAKRILELRADPQLQASVDRLAEKSIEGTLKLFFSFPNSPVWEQLLRNSWFGSPHHRMKQEFRGWTFPNRKEFEKAKREWTLHGREPDFGKTGKLRQDAKPCDSLKVTGLAAAGLEPARGLPPKGF